MFIKKRSWLNSQFEGLEGPVSGETAWRAASHDTGERGRGR